jgi:hypothetical protein
MRRLFPIVFALVFFAASPPAGADAGPFGLGDADRAAIVRVIDVQMQAFRRDDGDGAFAVASPGIRRMFGDADTFLTMVRDGYRPVYRPQRVRFLDIVDHHGRPAQRVFVVGPNGVAVIALYLMERQADGRWLIDGCILTHPAQARATDPVWVIPAAGIHRLRVAARDDRGWVADEWMNPCTGTMLPKVRFIRRVGSFIIGVGAYGTFCAGLGRDDGRRRAAIPIAEPVEFESSRVSG